MDSKRLSLYGVDLKDALRVALNTQLPKQPVKKKKAARKKAAPKGRPNKK